MQLNPLHIPMGVIHTIQCSLLPKSNVHRIVAIALFIWVSINFFTENQCRAEDEITQAFNIYVGNNQCFSFFLLSSAFKETPFLKRHSPKLKTCYCDTIWAQFSPLWEQCSHVERSPPQNVTVLFPLNMWRQHLGPLQGMGTSVLYLWPAFPPLLAQRTHSQIFHFLARWEMWDLHP